MLDLKVVSERSAAEMRQQEATPALKSALVELTANLIRVVRGAGEPELIVDQINSLAAAHNGYSDLVGESPNAALLGELIQYRPDSNPDDDLLDCTILAHAICRDAHQIVASTLVDQRIHRERVLNELHTHLRNFEDQRKRARRRRRAAHPRQGRALREALQGEPNLTSRERELREMYGIEPKPKE
jgi:hypothetical protein